MEFIDTHTHNSDEAFRGIEDEVIARSVAAGVVKLIQADISSAERPGMYALVERHPGVLYPMLGLYPGSVDSGWRDELDRMMEYRDRGAVAIGEIGLDYHFSTEFREEQKEAFRTQLELACRMDLPVDIHLRDATEDFITILEDSRHLHLRGALHAFSGSAEFFERVLRTGDWYAGIGGVLTFRNASIAKDILRIPLDRIILETDAPYLAPSPLRGSMNESCNIPVTAAALAVLKGTGIREVAEITTLNAKKLFGI